MKFSKKAIVVGAAAMLSVSLFSVSAFADVQTRSTNGYGILKGTLTSTAYTASFITNVSSNNDQAYLSYASSVQNSSGATIATKPQTNSSRGITTFYGSHVGLPAGSYAVNGTHGVQGGNTYGAYAVYTYVRI
ncbi:hypothetical protein [Paenibacillus lutrae]|nr:hypothetical protein [Paenibacillus lutrae]